MERINKVPTESNVDTLGICIWCDEKDSDCTFCDDPSAPMDFIG